jgi:secreted PhoX family phosphatase
MGAYFCAKPEENGVGGDFLSIVGIEGNPGRISRRAFLGLKGASAAALLLSGTPFHAFDARAALGQQPSAAAGYGPLVPKEAPAGGNDTTQYLRLPAQFNYQVISRQGQPMTDGQPTPGIFDAIGAFRPYATGRARATVRSLSATTRTGDARASSR